MEDQIFRLEYKLEITAILCKNFAYNTNIYINGVCATQQDIAELENRLRLGIEQATARCCNGNIYYKTI